ncbi:glycosyltransferase family 2 protein [Roseovarius rhodophyticola]|uniref:Glycosyltransferase family 2 protein n=1 Tax=Roseovarius rhodophyticola TaxID=3080827 RepID=A0ABZ2TGG5_9RHOB|nr:glycosyltransferase family 2 protein [Roseovarius sp. W115]MDV2929085.1 glycosyltransferase family 2 protein [Roseovarius sp. W115]
MSQHHRTSVAVFAHNEADGIAANIRAVQRAGLGPDDPVFVLINGSTDNTESIVNALAEDDPRIQPVVIALGDKANAWSFYVNHLAPEDCALHVFIDGDVQVSEGSIDEIHASLAVHPEALAASTLPQGGRTAKAWARRILFHHGMPGNFYALCGETLTRIKAQSINMPVGLIGDDPFLRWLLLSGLEPGATPDPGRIRPVPEAFFSYQSIPVTSWSGLRALWARQMRYQLRDLQMNLLREHLTTYGLSAMPRRIDSLYDRATPLMALRGQVKLRKLAFLYTYLRARSSRARPLRAAAWYEE